MKTIPCLKTDFEDHLFGFLNNKLCDSKSLEDAITYSIKSGGKRLRPLLVLIMTEILRKDVDKVLNYALALEFIHNYSLIHDDLPDMDNDKLRRGKPTTHVKYGVATAILSGDSLLNLAFNVATNDLISNDSKILIKAYDFLFKASGVNGMIDGQALEINNEVNSISDYLVMIGKKTGRLIEAGIVGPLFIFDVEEDSFNKFYEFSKILGQTFQIYDDRKDNDGIYDINGDYADKLLNENLKTMDSMLSDITNYDVSLFKKLISDLFLL